jgi:hypothetical protein
MSNLDLIVSEVLEEIVASSDNTLDEQIQGVLNAYNTDILLGAEISSL